MENELTSKQNMIIKQWGAEVVRDLRSNVGMMFRHPKLKSNVIKNRNDIPPKVPMQSMIIKGSSLSQVSLRDSLRDKYFKHEKTDAIDGVSITFARHGIFVLKGAGKGKRTPKDWLNPTLDRKIPELADKIGEVNADEVLEIMVKKLK